MSKTHLFLSEEDTRWQTALPNANELADRVVSAVFKDVLAHEDLDFLDGQKPVIIGLNLSNDGKVQELNRDYRGLDKPTNVLSFANLDDPDFYNDLAIYEEVELGDIIIALETLEREAELKGISLADHFCHLFAHGLLHLLGFDHIEDAEAEKMESAEIRILASLNINNPYEE